MKILQKNVAYKTELQRPFCQIKETGTQNKQSRTQIKQTGSNFKHTGTQLNQALPKSSTDIYITYRNAVSYLPLLEEFRPSCLR